MLAKCLRMWILIALLTGIGYPLLITGLGNMLMPARAGGMLIKSNDKVLGSLLIAQKFEDGKYFWPRPSAVDFNPLPSGGSNLGPTSALLKKAVDERRASLAKAHDVDERMVPRELLFASGSGLDPHITPHAALFQVVRVAKARGIEAKTLEDIVNQMVERPTLALFGEARVNVLRLNKHLDDQEKISRK